MPNLLLPNSTDEYIRQLASRGLMFMGTALRASSIDEENRGFGAVVATETPAMVVDFARYEVIEEVLIARGGEFPAQVPLLDNHTRETIDNVLGAAHSFSLEGDKWANRNNFTKDVERAENAFKQVRAGHVTDVSIGYMPLDYVDISPGKKEEVEGREFTARGRTLRITTRWKVHELSLTPIGADSMAKIRSKAAERTAPTRRSIFR